MIEKNIKKKVYMCITESLCCIVEINISTILQFFLNLFLKMGKETITYEELTVPGTLVVIFSNTTSFYP